MRTYLLPSLLATVILLSGCQTSDEESNQTATGTSTTEERTSRPKPEYFAIPPELAQKRVYICVDPADDTFHQKHDCAVLVACKGTFRNLTLTRAIEDFDRYHCETCSADLAYIYDEDVVQIETGLGK